MEPTPENQELPVNQERLEQWRPYLRTLARMQIEHKFHAKIDPSDIVQQTMIEAHLAMKQFRGETERELAGWLRRILARNLADEVRKFSRLKRDAGLEQSLQAAINDSSLCMERYLAGDGSSPEHRAIHKEQLVRLAAAVESLPEDQRMAVTLHHLQGKSACDIASQYGKTEVAVAGLLRRGLKRLRELMSDVAGE